MKKDRNTFFQESQMFNQSQIPNPNTFMNNGPFTMETYANQSFYAGPQNQVPMNYNTPSNQFANNNYNNDTEARLSKIERQLNRLDARLNKLENTTFYSNEDIETTNNIYMV